MISHFAAISPKVDINASVMDLTVRPPEEKCCLSSMNIAISLYAHCDFNEVAFTMRSVLLCKYSVKLMWFCWSFLQPGAPDHSYISSPLWSSWPISARTHTHTHACEHTQVKQPHTKHLYVCQALFLLCWVFHVTSLQMFQPWGHEHHLHKFSSQSIMYGT